MADLPEGAVANTDGTVSYALFYPVGIVRDGKNESIELVTVRRKNMGDNLAIKTMDNAIDVAATLIERLCDLPRIAVERLDDVDSEAIGAIIEGFMTPGRATGSGASAS